MLADMLECSRTKAGGLPHRVNDAGNISTTGKPTIFFAILFALDIVSRNIDLRQ